ncbi:hypothetical protein [Sporosarcina sp. FSL K6-1508]|uniref:hypothetical protein n=1 Tax=Sporosarcina sp. FSL K6-1508 TaxID=2921553 RepID=UPI0030F9BFEC
MNKFNVTLSYRYEYHSENDAILHRENIASGFILKNSYPTKFGTWICEYEKAIV